jgi:hypothetical protein
MQRRNADRPPVHVFGQQQPGGRSSRNFRKLGAAFGPRPKERRSDRIQSAAQNADG